MPKILSDRCGGVDISYVYLTLIVAACSLSVVGFVKEAGTPLSIIARRSCVRSIMEVGKPIIVAIKFSNVKIWPAWMAGSLFLLVLVEINLCQVVYICMIQYCIANKLTELMSRRAE